MQLYRLKSITHQLARTIVQCWPVQLGSLCTYLGCLHCFPFYDRTVPFSSLFLVPSGMYFTVKTRDCATFFIEILAQEDHRGDILFHSWIAITYSGVPSKKLFGFMLWILHRISRVFRLDELPISHLSFRFSNECYVSCYCKKLTLQEPKNSSISLLKIILKNCRNVWVILIKNYVSSAGCFLFLIVTWYI